MLLNCFVLPPFAPPQDSSNSWDAIERAFADAPSVALGQSWRAEPESGFRPGYVRCGWRDTTLWIIADLDDDDIWNDGAAFNEPLFLLGDVFEIFLRPAGGEKYFEFHVAPHNQKLQLQWPNARSIWQTRATAEPMPAQDTGFLKTTQTAMQPFLMREPILRSWTRVETGKWRVLVALETSDLGVDLNPGAVWRFLFSRYDATRGRESMLSSSAVASAETPDFHRQSDWGNLVFVGP